MSTVPQQKETRNGITLSFPAGYKTLEDYAEVIRMYLRNDRRKLMILGLYDDYMTTSAKLSQMGIPVPTTKDKRPN